MSYLVLARKFRPQTFASVIGQDHISRALANAIVRDKVAHAFLFTGPRGVGKTSMARVFARSLNCEKRATPAELSKLSEADARERVEPCGTCTNCQEIARSSSMGVWEIDGASNNSVDNVRDLIDSLRSLPPPGSPYKIYIIDEVHMLSTAAFNALLKSLEEPPPHTIFIFATTEPHKIPETVISRCQRYDFQRLTTETITDCLNDIAKGEGVDVEEEVLELIARKAEGGMRDAQSMLDRLQAFSKERVTIAQALQIFGVADRGLYTSISKAVLARDPQAVVQLLNDAFSRRVDVRQFVADLLLHFRNLLLVGISTDKDLGDTGFRRTLEVTKTELEELKAISRSTQAFHLQRLFDVAQSVADKALHSNFPRFVIEAGLIKMAMLEDLRPLGEVIGKIENMISNGAPLQARSATPTSPRTTSAVKTAPVPVQTAPIISKPARETETKAEEALPVGNPGDFNPSWMDFVNYVKSRSEVVLAAFLRRLSPKVFIMGKLELTGAEFDLQGVRDAGTFANLKRCLYGYSQLERWDVKLSPLEAVASNSSSPATNVPKKRAAPPPGSIADIEQEAERDHVSRVDTEARNSPLVKAALDVFGGSKIEKISVLK